MTPGPKRRSAVWNYFSKTDKDSLAICNLCKKSMKYFGGTTNLRQHLLRIHPATKLVVKTIPKEEINCEECNKIITIDNVCCHFETVAVENEYTESSPVPEENSHNVNELSSPSEYAEELNTTVNATTKSKKRDILGDAIMKTIKSAPRPSVVPSTKNSSINPICIRISEMLADLPPDQKARLEIKLLQTVYDEVFK